MSSTTDSLWSGSIDPSASSMPKTLLKHQAVGLGSITNNIAEAEIVSAISVDDAEGFINAPQVIHSFEIVAPLLGYQRFTLFSIRQIVALEFPIYFASNYIKDIKYPKCQNIGEFNANLQQILSSPETTKLINSIIAQSK